MKYSSFYSRGFVVASALLLVPISALLANTVNYTSDVTLSLPGVTFATFTIKSGSSFTSLTVNDNGSFTVTTAGNEGLTVEASRLVTFRTTGSGETTCNGSVATFTLGVPATVTVTPENVAPQCSSGGSSGGGGGGSANTATAPAPAAAQPASAPPAASATPAPGGAAPAPNAPSGSTPSSQEPGAPFPLANPSDGSLLRAQGDDKIYLITHGTRQWIKTAQEFAAKGLKWENVREVNPSVVENVSDTLLARASGDSRVYVVRGGVRRLVQSPDIFTKSGYEWQDVTIIARSEFNRYTASNLIRSSDGKVYVIVNGSLRWVATPQAFAANKFKWDRVQDVSQEEKDAYIEGVVLAK